MNARQKENYNYHKISALLADYGFSTIRLSDDWNAADFLALHIEGQTLKVQLKPRLTFEAKYRGKELQVCFPDGGHWYLYPHDELLNVVLVETTMGMSDSWRIQGRYSFNRLGRKLSSILEGYKIEAAG